jgi:hypothetical protein
MLVQKAHNCRAVRGKGSSSQEVRVLKFPKWLILLLAVIRNPKILLLDEVGLHNV